ncbi:MAG TPA: hypothetical protein VHA55_04685 [Pseudorhodoplanes sp.]|nr:hypothetical protein [Pseudorhodoplanes sp.]
MATARPTLRHYYHVYADGHYDLIVREHFQALAVSGLARRLDHLHVGFVGSAERVANARALVSSLAGPFTANVAARGWEQETQDILWADACRVRPPFLALYAHTKGASSDTEINMHWRRLMTRHTILGWKRAVQSLRGPVGAAGCFWAPFDNGRLIGRAEGTQYFAGNFWWARSEAIAALGPPGRGDRFDAELWIGGITRPPHDYRIACLFDAPLTVEELRPHARALTEDRRPHGVAR